MASPPRVFMAKPAPVARLMLPPTIAEVEMKPRSESDMCIVPPAPRLMPFSRPRISAKASFGSTPRASTWPWLRWWVAILSSGPSASISATPVASWPM